MCAVYGLYLEPDDEIIGKLRSRYGEKAAEKYSKAELYPKSEAPVIGPGGKVAILRWGFPVAGKSRVVFNARAETLCERSLFINCIGNRCLVPASSFYEWGEENGKKRKFKISVPEGTIRFAGLFKACIGKDGIKEYCFTIITTAPNAQMAAIHSRMPAIVEKGREDEWLDAKGKGILRPYEGEMKIICDG